MSRPLGERDVWLVDSLGVPSSVHDLRGPFECVEFNARSETALWSAVPRA